MLKIIIEKVSQSENFHLPKYHSDNSSGLDIVADINYPINLKQNEIFLVPTGIKLKIPRGYEGQVRPRSGLALNHGVTILNSPGTIDSDYRGEIKVILINHSSETFVIKPSMRIGQIVFSPIVKVHLKLGSVNIFETKRSSKGFGSTGLE
ncbi:dUTP diphosphatase [Alphaproteobacteria bacterium]|nr:dUTP diphosphatase [Alphaproteobacteria bacterium]